MKIIATGKRFPILTALKRHFYFLNSLIIMENYRHRKRLPILTAGIGALSWVNSMTTKEVTASEKRFPTFAALTKLIP